MSVELPGMGSEMADAAYRAVWIITRILAAMIVSPVNELNSMQDTLPIGVPLFSAGNTLP